MKSTLLKVLKFFLYASLIILVILLVFGLVLVLDWPLWVGFFILLALVGLCAGGLFLRKILRRRREQNFVEQVVEQDKTQIKTAKGKERENLEGLQARWKEAIDALRHSHLRKYGNPLYVIPWYLVLGESGSGKTTAISSAKLSTPFVDVKKVSGISGTRNCDWWFFEQAIIIDTAGRYAIPVDEGRDKEEWQQFINLLVKYRKREPLNGLVVTVAANKLLESTTETLEKDGVSIRRRIDELMRALGVKFPIYVMVTKCDLIQGMTQFCDRLPEKALDQPMGVINQELTSDISAFLDNTMDTIGERLRNIRILLVDESRSKTSDPGLLMFPEEFRNLKKGLSSFMQGAFGENPYQETPILRGLFFSSGRQEGTPYSHFLGALGLIAEKEVLPGTSKGLFLHDFFASIMPVDRDLFAPTRRALEWRTVTRNLGLVSWVLVGLAMCGLLSFSFVKNLKTLREVSHEFAAPLKLRGEFFVDLVTMKRFYEAIVNVENQNRNWWIPRFGLRESLNVEYWLKEKYTDQFRNGFLTPFDREIESAISGFNELTPDEIIGQYAAHLVRRINVIKSHLRGDGLETLKARPQPAYVSLLPIAEQGIGPEVRETFGTLYLHYLIWRKDEGDMSNKIEILQSWLRHILTLKEKNLTWVTAWINQHGTVNAMTLGEFWNGSLTAPGEKSVAPAFTRKGKEMTDSFLQEIEDALADPLILTTSKSAFRTWYRDASFDQWNEFGEDFLKGIEKLEGLKEWRSVAEKVSMGEGPFFSFLNRIAVDLEPLAGAGDVPPWLKQVYLFQLIKRLETASGGGTLSKITEKGMEVISKTLGKEGETATESQLEAARAYQEHLKALAEISPVAKSRKEAYKQALKGFTEAATTSDSPFFTAQDTSARLQMSMMNTLPAQGMFWNIIKGPLDFLWVYTRMEAACQLQSQWEEKVLSEAQGITGPQLMRFLLSKEGPVKKFIRDPLKPFIGWQTGRGYFSREAEGLGGAIPFQSSFFDFLNRGAQVTEPQHSYSVKISGLPTDTNPEAQLKPHKTYLELKCEEKNHTLTNQNYPVSGTFLWSPNTCSDVLFTIEVGDVVLTKHYSGQRGFPFFLFDFQSGQHIFYPHDFPREEKYLQRIGIKNISVHYEFRGEQEILKLFSALPEQVPESIVWCWDQ